MFDWVSENWWAAWLILAGALAVAEMLTLDLTLLMLAVGALAGGVTALVLPGLLWAQLLAAILTAVMTLFIVRPLLLRKMQSGPGYRSSVDKMVGSSGTVVREIADGRGGEVKVAGEIWSARSYDGSALPVGTPVEVFEIDGAVVVVYPAHKALP